MRGQFWSPALMRPPSFLGHRVVVQVEFFVDDRPKLRVAVRPRPVSQNASSLFTEFYPSRAIASLRCSPPFRRMTDSKENNF
jgi:hypothetical protein